MKESDMNNTSETNWDMIDSLTDETIDRTELPPLDDSFFARAKWRMPEKPVPVTGCNSRLLVTDCKRRCRDEGWHDYCINSLTNSLGLPPLSPSI